MASLKSYIRTLLSSWRDSHKSVPQVDFVAVSATLSYGFVNGKVIYTAPSDGFLVVEVPYPGTGFMLRERELYDELKHGDDNPDGWRQWTCGGIPIRKGATCWCCAYGPSTETTATIALRFYPYVGN